MLSCTLCKVAFSILPGQCSGDGLWQKDYCWCEYNEKENQQALEKFSNFVPFFNFTLQHSKGVIVSGLQERENIFIVIDVQTSPLSRSCFKNAYELLNLRSFKISISIKTISFSIWVEFHKVPLKFHTKYLTHTLKDVDFIHMWKFKSS